MVYLKTKIRRKKQIYGKQVASYILLKLVKGIMREGKFEKYYNILMQGTILAIKKVQSHLKCFIKKNPISFLFKIIREMAPFCDLKSMRVSGRKALIPIPFRFQRKMTVTIRILIHGFLKQSERGGKTLKRAICLELFYLYLKRNISEAFQKKQEFVKNIFYNEKNLRFLKGM